MRCTYCRPHADGRRQRLCHEGHTLWRAYVAAAEKWSAFRAMPDPPIVATENALKAKNQARAEYRAHMEG